jgi:hypothetical protein
MCMCPGRHQCGEDFVGNDCCTRADSAIEELRSNSSRQPGSISKYPQCPIREHRVKVRFERFHQTQVVEAVLNRSDATIYQASW